MNETNNQSEIVAQKQQQAEISEEDCDVNKNEEELNKSKVNNQAEANLQEQQQVENNIDTNEAKVNTMEEQNLNSNGEEAIVDDPNKQVLNEQFQPSNEQTNINKEEVKNGDNTTEQEADDYHEALNNLFYPEEATKQQTTSEQNVANTQKDAVSETQQTQNMDTTPLEGTINEENIDNITLIEGNNGENTTEQLKKIDENNKILQGITDVINQIGVNNR